MSQYYKVDVTVDDFGDDKRAAIVAALRAAWNFDKIDPYPDFPDIIATGINDISGGDDDLAKEIAEAVFAANGGTCAVTVNTWWMEMDPDGTYFFGAARPSEDENGEAQQ